MSNTICPECQEEVRDTVDMCAYQRWLKVMNYIEMEYLQGDITLPAYEELADCLMSFKYLIEEADERAEKEFSS